MISPVSSSSSFFFLPFADEIEFDSPENLPEFNPYLNYGGDEAERDRADARDKKVEKNRKSGKERRREKNRKEENSSRRKRPGTAGRHGRASRKERDEAPVQDEADEFEQVMYSRENRDRDMQEEYPTARGLVGR